MKIAFDASIFGRDMTTMGQSAVESDAQSFGDALAELQANSSSPPESQAVGFGQFGIFGRQFSSQSEHFAPTPPSQTSFDTVQPLDSRPGGSADLEGTPVAASQTKWAVARDVGGIADELLLSEEQPFEETGEFTPELSRISVTDPEVIVSVEMWGEELHYASNLNWRERPLAKGVQVTISGSDENVHVMVGLPLPSEAVAITSAVRHECLQQGLNSVKVTVNGQTSLTTRSGD